MFNLYQKKHFRNYASDFISFWKGGGGVATDFCRILISMASLTALLILWALFTEILAVYSEFGRFQPHRRPERVRWGALAYRTNRNFRRNSGTLKSYNEFQFYRIFFEYFLLLSQIRNFYLIFWPLCKQSM